MTRLTERDRQIIGKAYQGQLAESIARDMQISTFTVSTGTLKRLGTSLKNIRAAARTGVKLEKIIIDLEGNGHDSTPPRVGHSVLNTICAGFHREAPCQHRIQAGG